jgi:hypothetical protein
MINDSSKTVKGAIEAFVLCERFYNTRSFFLSPFALQFPTFNLDIVNFSRFAIAIIKESE